MSETLSAGTVSMSVVPDTKGFGKLLSGALAGESGNWSQLGKKIGKDIAAGLGIATVAIGIEATKAAASYQTLTTQIVTGAGESQANIELVRKGILSMAGAVGTMPDELAKGMYLIESAGYHGAAGLDVLKAAAKGAKVGGADMADVANGLTTALTDYNIPADRANAVTSALVETVAVGKMHMQDLAKSLGMVMPKASALGVSFQDVTGALATMTGAGMTARRASMNLANTILSLGAPSNKASVALGEIGMSAQQVKDDLSKKGLAGTLQEIEEHVGSTFPKGSVAAVEAFKNILGGATGYGTALALTGTHMAAFKEDIAKIGTALLGQSKDVAGFAMTQKDLNFQYEAFSSSVKAIEIRLGDYLIPIIEKTMMWVSKHKTLIEATAAVIGTAMVAAMGLWTVSLFAAGGALAFVTAPILAIAVGLSALAVGVIYAYNHFKIFHDIVNDIFRWLKDIVVGTIDFVKAHWDLIVGVFLGPIALVAAELIKHWKTITTDVSNVIKDVVGFFAGMPDRIVKALGDIGSVLTGIGSAILSGLWDGMKTAWKDVSGWLGGLGKTIAHLKGPIEYDRGLLIPHGNSIMDGLNQGLGEGFTRVMANVASMAGQISSGFSTSVNASISGRMSENGGPGTPVLVKASTGSLDSATAAIRAGAVATAGRMSENGGPGATSADIAALNATVASLALSFDASLTNQVRTAQVAARQGVPHGAIL